MRIKRRFREPHLRILICHLPLAGRDIRPALENLRGESSWNRRGSDIKGRLVEAKVRGRLSRQHGDRVFVLRALLQHQLQLRRSRIEQRCLLRNRQARRNAAFVLVVHQVQTFFLDVDRFANHVGFAVKLAQVEVVGSEFGGQHQARVLQISRGPLQGSVGRLQPSAHAAKQIHLIVDRKRNRKGVFGVRLNQRGIRALKVPVARNTLALAAGIRA